MATFNHQSQGFLITMMERRQELSFRRLGLPGSLVWLTDHDIHKVRCTSQWCYCLTYITKYDWDIKSRRVTSATVMKITLSHTLSRVWRSRGCWLKERSGTFEDDSCSAAVGIWKRFSKFFPQKAFDVTWATACWIKAYTRSKRSWTYHLNWH